MSTPISRRSFLTGATAALGAAGLWPLMARRALAQPTEAPTRVIFWYVPEGCAQQAFWPASGPGPLVIDTSAHISGGRVPRSEGRSINSYRSAQMGTYCLQPLAGYESDLTLISGFRINNVGGDGAHRANTEAALTGGRRDEGSLDQWLGDHLRGPSAFHAIFSSVYGEHVARGLGGGFGCPFRTKTGAPAAPTWNPVTTYNQVFPTGVDGSLPRGPDHRLRSRLRIMGAVGSRLEDVRCRGGAAARERVESYLGSIERIESETRALVEQGDTEVEVSVDLPPNWETIDSNDRYWHRPENFGTLVRIQIDTTIAALALDRTRVSLMQFSATGGNNGNGIAGTHYQHIGISDLEPGETNDHTLSHNSTPAKRRNQARIFRWYYAQLKYLIDGLKAIPDGAGTLFDSTLIVCCSEFGSYDHRYQDVPFMLAGNPGGAFRKGVYLDAYNGSNHRHHADLLLAIARGAGMDISRFGNSTTPYDAILA